MWHASRAFVLAASLCAVVHIGQAHAQAPAVDAKRLAALLIVQAGANGLDLEIADAEAVGTDVVLRNVEIATETFKEVRLEKVRALPDGGYVIGRIAGPSATTETPAGKWSLGAWSLSEVLVPAESDKQSMAFYSQSFEMQPSRMTSNTGATLLDIGRIRWTSSPFALDRTLESRLEPINISFDVTTTVAQRDAGYAETLSLLGVSKVDLQFGGDGTWNSRDGRTAFALVMNWRDMGKLTTTMNLTGLTSEFFQALQKFSEQAIANPEDMKTTGAAAGMELAGQMKLNAMSLRFDDASLTRKAIDLAARRANQPRKDIVAQLKATAPLMLAGLGDAKLAAQASTALATYLDAPKSLEFKLQPKAAVTPMEVFLLAVSAPQSIAQRLGIQITANKP